MHRISAWGIHTSWETLHVCLPNTKPWRQWRNWRGGKGTSCPPGKLNVKTGPPIADTLMFIILLVFSRFLFSLRFSGCFRFLASIDIHNIQIHCHFLTFFSECWQVASLQWPVAPFSWILPLLAQTSVVTPLLDCIQGVSQLLKQSDWAQIQDFKWYHNDDYIYWKVKR